MSGRSFFEADNRGAWPDSALSRAWRRSCWSCVSGVGSVSVYSREHFNRTNLREIPSEGEAQKPPVFATTHRAVVLSGRHDTTHATAALEGLCQIYWHPLYVHERRRGHSGESILATHI